MSKETLICLVCTVIWFRTWINQVSWHQLLMRIFYPWKNLFRKVLIQLLIWGNENQNAEFILNCISRIERENNSPNRNCHVNWYVIFLFKINLHLNSKVRCRIVDLNFFIYFCSCIHLSICFCSKMTKSRLPWFHYSFSMKKFYLKGGHLIVCVVVKDTSVRYTGLCLLRIRLEWFLISCFKTTRQAPY